MEVLASTPPGNSPSSRSPDLETDTASQIQPAAKPLSFTNGLLKRHLPSSPIIAFIYKECLKNHAASLGGHALDGCGEFMPCPNSTTSDPTSLKCAACGCHRNFHRREPEDWDSHTLPPPPPPPPLIEYQPHHRHHPPPPPPPPPPHGQRSPNSASPPPISSSYYPSAPHMLLALSGDKPAGTVRHDRHGGSSSSSRKRHRTKFSQFQKEKMYEFAERIGWKMVKSDEELVKEFCNQVKIERGVLKVWMHNNKNTFGKHRVSLNNNHNNNNHHHHNNNSPSSLHPHHGVAGLSNHNNNGGDPNHNHHHSQRLFGSDNAGTNASSSSS